MSVVCDHTSGTIPPRPQASTVDMFVWTVRNRENNYVHWQSLICHCVMYQLWPWNAHIPEEGRALTHAQSLDDTVLQTSLHRSGNCGNWRTWPFPRPHPELTTPLPQIDLASKVIHLSKWTEDWQLDLVRQDSPPSMEDPSPWLPTPTDRILSVLDCFRVTNNIEEDCKLSTDTSANSKCTALLKLWMPGDR